MWLNDCMNMNITQFYPGSAIKLRAYLQDGILFHNNMLVHQKGILPYGVH